jgi:hypothetical protein
MLTAAVSSGKNWSSPLSPTRADGHGQGPAVVQSASAEQLAGRSAVGR